MIAYKLFRLTKKGSLTSLFINKRFELPLKAWLVAESHKTKGFTFRKGWHCCKEPVAPHLKMVLKSGEVRVWAKVEIGDYVEFPRPESQGGDWLLADKMRIIKLI